jgi:ABC-2 type transport system ATP-binding protein
MSIKVEFVTKIYGDQKALDLVSFEVKSNEVVGFLGPNGAGKSTMMKIISCFIPPSSGKVLVCGMDISQQSLEVRKKVGYLPEGNPLYLDMYVREYLEMVGGIYRLKNISSRIKELIGITGLDLEKGKKIGTLSKGYKQRVGIAQAMIHDPEVLILDEPTSGLDPNQLVGIRLLIKELGKSKTVLFSSHIMQEVEAVSDHVIILNRGKIVANSDGGDLGVLIGQGLQLEVEFDQAVQIQELKKIEGVDKVSEVGSNQYVLSSKSDLDLRASVSKWAQNNEVLILSLNQRRSSLEDVFQKLTSQPK